jgi:hypothetical protein
MDSADTNDHVYQPGSLHGATAASDGPRIRGADTFACGVLRTRTSCVDSPSSQRGGDLVFDAIPRLVRFGMDYRTGLGAYGSAPSDDLNSVDCRLAHGLIPPSQWAPSPREAWVEADLRTSELSSRCPEFGRHLKGLEKDSYPSKLRPGTNDIAKIYIVIHGQACMPVPAIRQYAPTRHSCLLCIAKGGTVMEGYGALSRIDP